jgi:cytochrome oxidase assembly protein ShyY1
MPIFTSSSAHQPKGDHNRRIALDLGVAEFAQAAGLTPNQVQEYEMTSIDHEYDEGVAQRYGAALERLEANPVVPRRVIN